MRPLALFISVALLLAACGTKGPLTLPQKPAAASDASTKSEAGR